MIHRPGLCHRDASRVSVLTGCINDAFEGRGIIRKKAFAELHGSTCGGAEGHHKTLQASVPSAKALPSIRNTLLPSTLA